MIFNDAKMYLNLASFTAATIQFYSHMIAGCCCPLVNSTRMSSLLSNDLLLAFHTPLAEFTFI